MLVRSSCEGTGWRTVSSVRHRRRRSRRCGYRRPVGRPAAPRDVFPDAVCRLPIRPEGRAASPGPSDSTDSFGDRNRHSQSCSAPFQVSRRVSNRGRAPESGCPRRSLQPNSWPICHPASPRAPSALAATPGQRLGMSAVVTVSPSIESSPTREYSGGALRPARRRIRSPTGRRCRRVRDAWPQRISRGRSIAASRAFEPGCSPCGLQWCSRTADCARRGCRRCRECR
jgi:hypothetical protein